MLLGSFLVIIGHKLQIITKDSSFKKLLGIRRKLFLQNSSKRCSFLDLWPVLTKISLEIKHMDITVREIFDIRLLLYHCNLHSEGRGLESKCERSNFIVTKYFLNKVSGPCEGKIQRKTVLFERQ